MTERAQPGERAQLVEHLRVFHPALYRGMSPYKTWAQLGRIHSTQHFRYTGSQTHWHDGENSGPDNRPLGWRTGGNVVIKGLVKRERG